MIVTIADFLKRVFEDWDDFDIECYSFRHYGDARAAYNIGWEVDEDTYTYFKNLRRERNEGYFKQIKPVQYCDFGIDRRSEKKDDL